MLSLLRVLEVSVYSRVRDSTYFSIHTYFNVNVHVDVHVHLFLGDVSVHGVYMCTTHIVKQRTHAGWCVSNL